MKRLLKSPIFMFILGAIIFSGIGVYAEFILSANEIMFTPTNEDWNVGNVEGAINDLYNKVEKNTVISKLKQTDTIYNYSYTGSFQELNVAETGYYLIELWGAQGYNPKFGLTSSYPNTVGKGAYTSGIIKLNKDDKLYIYVGGMATSTTNGGYNGGGCSNSPHADANNGAGGGSTDVRLLSGDSLDFESLKTRIMVAAGGGAGFAPASSTSGGDLRSPSGYATQTSGYQFGLGQTDLRSGGGGGYYGGTANGGSGEGGSSYISGHLGCDSISEESTEDNIIHTEKMIHYSGMYFIHTNMISGNGLMPNTEGTGKESGHSGNGYAKITLYTRE